jgi:hypothetical protein
MTKLMYADVKKQERLGIRYDYVPNERRISKSNREDIALMREQLALWGEFPLTKEFINSLGDRANADLIARRKRKRDSAEDDHRASKVAALYDPHADISPYAAYHAPSSPPLADSIPRLSATNTVDYRYPQSQQPVSHHTQSEITQQSLRNQNSFSFEDSTSAFDHAFAKHLKEMLVPESTVELFLNLPALAEQTQALKRRFEEQIREKEDCLNGDKIEEGSWLREMYGGKKRKACAL